MNKAEKDMIQVASFQVPKEGAEAFLEDRERTATAAIHMMEEFCPKVIRTTEDPREGEAIISYFKNGEEAFKVLLDPFEVPIMKMAMERGTLKSYILAKNGLTEEDALYLSQLSGKEE